MQAAMAIAHQNLVAIGEISPSSPTSSAYNEKYDNDPRSKIYVFEQEGVIIATVTFTADQDQGLPVDKYFPMTLQELRDQGRRLAQGWRLSIHKDFRGSGLINIIFSAGKNYYEKMDCDHHVLFANVRLQNMYVKKLNVDLIAERLISFDKQITNKVGLFLGKTSDLKRYETTQSSLLINNKGYNVHATL